MPSLPSAKVGPNSGDVVQCWILLELVQCWILLELEMSSDHGSRKTKAGEGSGRVG